jgi:hypothetical protein
MIQSRPDSRVDSKSNLGAYLGSGALTVDSYSHPFIEPYRSWEQTRPGAFGPSRVANIGVLLCRAATARELAFINKITAHQRQSGLRG